MLERVHGILFREPPVCRFVVGDQQARDLLRVTPPVATQVSDGRSVQLALQLGDLERQRLLHSHQEVRVVCDEEVRAGKDAHEGPHDGAQVLGDFLERHPLDHQAGRKEVASRALVVVPRVEERVPRLTEPRLAVRDDRVVAPRGALEEIDPVILDHAYLRIVQDVTVVRGELLRALDDRG